MATAFGKRTSNGRLSFSRVSCASELFEVFGADQAGANCASAAAADATSLDHGAKAIAGRAAYEAPGG